MIRYLKIKLEDKRKDKIFKDKIRRQKKKIKDWKIKIEDKIFKLR